MNSVVHFEIPTQDLARAKTFYQTVFGWELQQFDDNNVLATTTASDSEGQPTKPGAINGSLYKAVGKTPTVMIDVPDINAHLQMVKANGGVVVDEPVTVPDMGMYARFNDPDGNLIGLWQVVKAPAEASAASTSPASSAPAAASSVTPIIPTPVATPTPAAETATLSTMQTPALEVPAASAPSASPTLTTTPTGSAGSVSPPAIPTTPVVTTGASAPTLSPAPTPVAE